MDEVEKLKTAVQAALSMLQERDVRIINLCVDLAILQAEKSATATDSQVPPNNGALNVV